MRIEWQLIHNDTQKPITHQNVGIGSGQVAVWRNGWFVGLFEGDGEIVIAHHNNNPKLVEMLVKDAAKWNPG